MFAASNVTLKTLYLLINHLNISVHEYGDQEPYKLTSDAVLPLKAIARMTTVVYMIHATTV